MTRERILVVDDTRQNIELVLAVLSGSEFIIEGACDATDANAKIAEFRPDLVLMDIQMPGVDGLELTGRLKANPLTRDILIVAFTAYAMVGDEEKMLAGGCDGYLSKPINVLSFADEIRLLLRSRR
jgi:two-component system cell cycle response regulator DivK